jgi:hypothetical protein
MEEANVGRMGRADIVSVAYTEDERLALLIDALIRLASTMETSRKAVTELENSQPSVLIFEEPDQSDLVEFSVSQDLSSLGGTTESVERILAPALEELGGTP